LRPFFATINTPEIAKSRVAVPVESRTSASTDAGTQEPVESKSSKRAESRKKERSESRKKKRRTWKGPVELVILTGLIVTIMFVGRTDLRIVGAFTVLPRENADVRSAVAGIIEEIYVDEGDEVKTGDLIARLSDFDLRADLLKTEAQMNQTRARLQLLETGPTPDEIEVAKTAVSRAEDKVKYAQARLVRDKDMFKQNLVPQATFEDTEEMAAVAVVDLDTARSKLKILLGGSRPEEIDATRAALDGLETQRKYLQEQLQLLKIVSPATGIVATPSRQLKEMKRTLVNKGDLIVKVFDFKTVIAEMVIPEKEIADIKVGQEVVLKARSFPEQTFHGTVTDIATAAQGPSSSGSGQAGGTPTIPIPISTSSKTILVTTEIENPSLLLKAQMTGQAKILCGERRFVDLTTRRLARTLKVEFWSWW
jgi:multidrug resistance efflux pump